jgi:hypothetical protein
MRPRPLTLSPTHATILLQSGPPSIGFPWYLRASHSKHLKSSKGSLSLYQAGLVQAHVKGRGREGEGYMATLFLSPARTSAPSSKGKGPGRAARGCRGHVFCSCCGRYQVLSFLSPHLLVMALDHSCEWTARWARHGLLLGWRPGSGGIPGCVGSHAVGGRFGSPCWSCLNQDGVATTEISNKSGLLVPADQPKKEPSSLRRVALSQCCRRIQRSDRHFLEGCPACHMGGIS